MKPSRNVAVSFLVTVFLLALLLTQVDLWEVYIMLSRIQLFWLAAGFFFYFIGYFMRALRFSLLLKGKVNVERLFPVVCIHYLVNNILPARTGELSYIYLVKKLEGISASEGFSTLTIARFFDFMSIAFLFILSAFLADDVPPVVGDALYYISLAACLLVAVFVFLVCRSGAFISLLDRVIHGARLHRFSAIVYIRDKMVETLTNLRVLRSRKLIFNSLWSSLLIWSCIYLMTYSVMEGMGFEYSVFLVVLGSTLSVFSNILPIPSLGGFGVYEGAWALAFISLGMEQGTAIASGLGVHVVIIFYMTLLGAYGLLSTFSGRE
ncbi:MAG: lysylphosphatidylglycerol synthase transmembrane domain-containing protein, partial [Candidatus Altiarchaeota archaeon]|nr:lysylphosphatidylglycerol synthase transmembrane domain-containing protein [Candidatus Altiarchaeota archaeon]